MRHLKKYASLLLALVMALALAAPAFAADPVPDPEGDPAPATGTTTTTQKGTIEVENAIDGETYSLYKIFDLDYSANPESFSYTISSSETNSWYGFVSGNGAGANYVTLAAVPGQDGLYYVSWKTDANGKEVGDAAEFAKAALKYAEEKKIQPDQTGEATKVEGNVTCKFTEVDYGYYLLDSSVGALCALNSATPNATVKEKNEVPSIDKQVKEVTGTDATGKTLGDWGDKNDANIGDTVEFRTIIYVKPGAQNYVLHDTMNSDQLAFGGADSVSVAYQSRSTENSDPDDPDAGFKNVNGLQPVKETDYHVTAGTEKAPETACTFEVKFENSWLEKLKFEEDTEYRIVVSYTATVQPDAVIAGNGNVNDTHLVYGNGTETTHDSTTTYVWEFKVEKYTTGTDDEGNSTEVNLAGATFKLSKDKNGTEVIEFVSESTANGDVYRVATQAEKNDDEVDTVTEFTTNNSGKFDLRGLDAGIYYLTEVNAPEGYNKLTEAIKIQINGVSDEKPADATTGAEAVIAGSVLKYVKDKDDKETSEKIDDKNIKVLNNTGAVLPSTGGIGTTIFYVVGGVLVVGAAILLVTKKRMSSR